MDQHIRRMKFCERYEQADTEADIVEGSLVLFGDSDIARWKEFKKILTAGAEPISHVFRCGVDGATLAELLVFAPRLLEKYVPRIVLIAAGENDLAYGRHPAKVFSDFRSLVNLVSDSLLKLIYISTKPEPATFGDMQLRQNYLALNAMIEQHCASDDRLLFVNSWHAMLLQSGSASYQSTEQSPNPGMYAKDGLHLSKRGYSVWVHLVQEALATLVLPAGSDDADAGPGAGAGAGADPSADSTDDDAGSKSHI